MREGREKGRKWAEYICVSLKHTHTHFKGEHPERHVSYIKWLLCGDWKEYKGDERVTQNETTACVSSW